MGKGDKSTRVELISREYTVHLHKRLHGITFKKKAPRAIKELKTFAKKMMGTTDNRVDTRLNKAVWKEGVRNVPKRIRVRLSRKRNDDEDAEESLYTLIEHVPVADFKGLETKVVEDMGDDE